MAKYTFNKAFTDRNWVSSLLTNLGLISDAFDDTLSRSGKGPNSMEVDLDLNGNKILNLPAPSDPTDPVRLQDLDDIGSTYELPVADQNTLGGVKPGPGVVIANNGTLSTNESFGNRYFYGYRFPPITITATQYTLSAGDSGYMLRFTADTDISVILPPTIDKGCAFLLVQKGNGKIVLSPSTGASLSSEGNFNASGGLNAGLTVIVEENVDNNSAQYYAIGSGTTVSSAQFAPFNTSLPIISGIPYVGNTLSVTQGGWAYGPTGFAYQWKRNGANISGATNSTYTLQNADIGATISCTVFATNSVNTVSATSNSTAVITTGPPVLQAAPAITGTIVQGQTLTGSDGTWAGTPTGYSRQWYRDTVAIPSAINSTYVLQAGDVGALITFGVIPTNDVGPAPESISAAVGPILATGAVPVNTSVPTISGVAAVGGTLTATTGIWTNSVSITYAYQWKSNGTNVGTNSNTYSPVSGDIGHTITVEVTPTNPAGSGTAASSAATAAITGSTYSFTNAEAAAYVAAMSVAPSDTRKGLIDTLFSSLKNGATSSSNILAKLDVLQIYKSHDAQAARLNAVNPATYTATAVGTPTFATDGGYTASSGPNYINTTWAPINGVNYTLNSGSVHVYWNTNVQEDITDMGAISASGTGVTLRSRDVANGGKSQFRSNDATATVIGSAIGTSIGMFTINRESSTQKRLSRSGTSLQVSNTTAAGLTSNQIYIGCFNNNGATPSSFSTKQAQMFAAGAGLTTAEITDMSNAFATYFGAF